MNKLLSIFFTLFIITGVYGAEMKVGMEIREGLNKTFLGNYNTQSKFGHSYGLGVNFILKKNNRLELDVSLLTDRNTYSYKVLKNTYQNVWLQFDQSGYSIRTMVGLPLNKRMKFKSGIFISKITYSFIGYEWLTDSGHGYHGNSGFKDGYDSKTIQAGIVSVISYAVSKRFYINAELQQHGTSFLDADYTFINTNYPQIKVSQESKPTFIFLGVSLFLKNKRTADSTV